ncbi:MAG: bifunctional diaminohydroxyphosphoribosylaminopyrimidine deaminase/5-amino-6-(5-phosphoribosylamino)uracil reductase RibD [Candidatus Babeliales bacterium]
MFTGIIQHKGTIASIKKEASSPLQVTVCVQDTQFIAAQKVGDSIAIDGICLSIVRKDLELQQLMFQAIEQTCIVTTIGARVIGDVVNVEPALSAQDKLDGHVVTGHIDYKVKVLDVVHHEDGSWQVFIENKKPELIVLRGSVALNGVSLTVSHVCPYYFCVSLIPITLEKTNLSFLKKGHLVNVEYDTFLKAQKGCSIDLASALGTRVFSDEQAMNCALQLAQLGVVTAPPNPWVGSVIVKDNVIIGAGYHTKAGEPHAEVEALRSMRDQLDAQGARMYVTLEPCCHIGKTGPCTQAIIEAGITHVTIGMLDPDMRVQGKGVKALEAAGIQVTVGVLSCKVAQSLKPYIHHRTTGMPFVIAKVGVSIDGKIAAADGSARWITDAAARQEVHELRARCQAVLVGQATVIKDNPQLTVRLENYTGPQPVRVVLDTYGVVTNPDLHIFNQEQAKTLMITSNQCNQETKELWQKLGIEYCVVHCTDGRLDLVQVYKELGRRQVISVLVEGGSRLQTELLKTGAYQELHVYLGPVIIGSNGISLFDTVLGSSMDDALALKKIGQTPHCIIFER